MSELDERIARGKAQHSCLKRLDQFMYCMTLTHQLDTYYRDGTYANCPQLFKRWQTCLRAKLRKPAEGDAMLQQEQRDSASGEHVFQFKPEFAKEAQNRYGVEALEQL